MLLVARAAPMAIMALPASPARPQVKLSKLPARRMLEPISLRFENRREMEAARRQIGASGRKQVSVTAAPIERPWRPRTPLSQLPLYLLRIIRRDGRTLRV